MSKDMKIKAIAPWFGGKRTMAPLIVEQLGKHTQYVEPFCGSMAVLFAKEPSQKETVNDLHGDLINLARVLQDKKLASNLYGRLKRTLFSQETLERAQSCMESSRLPFTRPKEKGCGKCWYCGKDAYEIWRSDGDGLAFCRTCAAVAYASIRLRTLGHGDQADDLDTAYGIDTRPQYSEWTIPRGDAFERAPSVNHAYWYFLACWMGRNGTAGTARLDYQIAVRWTKNGGSPTVRFRHATESLPAWHERLRNVVILRRDAFGIMDRFEDCEGTAIYADPPYEAGTRAKGAVKNGRGGKYLHEFEHSSSIFGDDDHTRLAKILRGYRKARIVVSYYDCPRIRELYEGWTFIEHTRQKHLHAQNGRGARPKEAPEILIVNGPSYAAAK